MTGISATPRERFAPLETGLRPVELRHDLRPLADLIELVFADSMDSGGRNAIRELRQLSHLGYGLKLVARLNELALGISMGYVYLQAGALVGNVSVYPARYPRQLGETWILANVAVHPQHQGRGIGSQLLGASLAMLRRRGAARAILQVDAHNAPARALYQRHCFQLERAWKVWRRSGFKRAAPAERQQLRITKLRRGDWAAAYALAQAARPNSRGGFGWLQPLQASCFQKPLWKQLFSLFFLSCDETWAIRDEASGALLACCSLESAVGYRYIKARLIIQPGIDSQPYAAALLDKVAARYASAAIELEHPADDAAVSDLLKRHHFKIKRDVQHMRLDF